MVIIESAESMNEAAANALLKTLEEPSGGILVLLASRPEKLLETIKSRCQEIRFARLNIKFLKEVFLEIVESEKIEISIINTYKEELLFLADGSPGALKKNIKSWQEIADNLWPMLQNLREKPIDALLLAKEITEGLIQEQQVWLISWLQIHIWMKDNEQNFIKTDQKIIYLF